VPPTVVWFRRDLRIHDHPALTEAVRAGGTVVPLFVWDPAILHGRFASPNRAWYLHGAVRALGDALAVRGAALHVRIGRPAEVLGEVVRETGARTVLASRDYAPHGRRRDREVANVLGELGVSFELRRGLLVHEPEDLPGSNGGAPRVFTPFLRRWEQVPVRPLLPPPDEIPSNEPVIPATELPDLDALGVPQPTADASLLPEPGEPAARRRLETWLDAGPDHGPAAYHRTRDRLDDPYRTSRLSPDIRFGLLSPVEVVMRAMAVDGGGDGSSRFASELAWRDFYAHLLWHEPGTAREPFLERFRGVAWPGDPDAVEAWQRGRTGYPVVDAAMRELLASGWLPNRARMIVASFLTKDLLADWRAGEAHFMRHLLDGDPASNLGGWQWAASIGTDAQPWFRVFNPVTQGRRVDPEGSYVRRWLPELGLVPSDKIHEPWTMTAAEMAAANCRIGREYPAPIVDHAEARRRALAFFGSIDPGTIRS
jgi:deoxyribodipyrimidine photo-lyase